MSASRYTPEPFDLSKPSHRLAADLLRRIGHRNDIEFGPESHADVTELIGQLRASALEAIMKQAPGK